MKSAKPKKYTYWYDSKEAVLLIDLETRYNLEELSKLFLEATAPNMTEPPLSGFDSSQLASLAEDDGHEKLTDRELKLRLKKIKTKKGRLIAKAIHNPKGEYPEEIKRVAKQFVNWAASLRLGCTISA